MNGYTIEDTGDRVLVRGSIPVADFSALQKIWAGRGLDALALGVSSALGATLAACRKDDVEAWTKEVGQRAATLADGDAELEWLLGPDTGTSSKSIFSVLASTEQLRVRCHASIRWGLDVPHDPDDFGRCHRLLEKFPAWRGRLAEVADACPKWLPMVGEWERMTALYLEELPSGYCPKLYELMRSLRAEAPTKVRDE